MSIQRRSFLVATAAGGGSILLSACGGGDDDNAVAGTGSPATQRNIVEVAQATPEFSTLVEAVTAAGLAPTLSGPGPFTLFAPTNAAFSALLSELGITKAQLLADTSLLNSVLGYHVLPSRVDAAAVASVLGRPITTTQGGYFKVENSDGLRITDGRNRIASITATDTAASNGVIHTVNAVLLPADRTVLQAVQAAPGLSTLAEALTAANLTGLLSGPGPFTLFAPSNVAFAAALTELGLTREQLFADTTRLTAVLAYHVVDGLVLRAQVPVGTPIATRQGATFIVAPDLTITDQVARGARITATDTLASNGVIHVIDNVLLPTVT